MPVLLEPGDIIVFPQGDPHVLASAAGMRGPKDPALHPREPGARLPVRVDYGGTGRGPVHIVCGFLACDARPFNPLLATLPRVLSVKKRTDGYSDMLESFTRCALPESRLPRAGGEVVLARLSELRKWRRRCGGHLFTEHPAMGLVDVYAAVIPELRFQPMVHVNYADTVLPMHDGLPKQRDFPREMGGSGLLLPE